MQFRRHKVNFVSSIADSLTALNILSDLLILSQAAQYSLVAPQP